MFGISVRTCNAYYILIYFMFVWWRCSTPVDELAEADDFHVFPLPICCFLHLINIARVEALYNKCCGV